MFGPFKFVLAVLETMVDEREGWVMPRSQGVTFGYMEMQQP